MSYTDPAAGTPQEQQPPAPDQPQQPAQAPPPPPTPDPSSTPASAPSAAPTGSTSAASSAPAAASGSDSNPPPDPGADLRAELDALRQQIADLDAKTSSGQLTLAQTDADLAQKVDQLRSDFASWPTKTGEYADKPQPWDLQAHGLPQPGVTRDHLPGGQPDELSPVVIAHNKPLLTGGMAGDAVRELADLLAKVGYPTSISQGQNHAGSFDDTVAAAVNTFKRDFHVLEDPTQFRDVAQAERFVGPWIWEALIRAATLATKAVGL